MKDRLHTGLVVGVLLLVGALLGSIMLEWGDRRGGGEGLSTDRTPLSRGADRGYEGARISLEVLNGAGDPGAAEKMSERLREMGFDVKTFGNARSFDQARTELLDRSERPGAAGAIADSLGGVPVRVEPAPELYLDASLLLGADWREVLARVTR